MATYETSLDYTGGNRFNKDALLAICNSVQKFVAADNSENMDVNLTLQFADNHIIKGPDFEQLLDDQFAMSKALQQFEVAGLNYKTKRRMSVEIGHPYAAPIRIRIAGDRDTCILARGEIENIIEGTREWYRPLVSRDEWWYAGVVNPIILIIIFASLYSFERHQKWLDDPAGTKDLINVGLQTAFVAFILGRLRTYLFPRIEFDIGKSGMKAANRSGMRNVVLVVIVLGIIVGVISSVIASRF